MTSVFRNASAEKVEKQPKHVKQPKNKKPTVAATNKRGGRSETPATYEEASDSDGGVRKLSYDQGDAYVSDSDKSYNIEEIEETESVYEGDEGDERL